MPLILNLETSTRICSVALTSSGNVVGLLESHEDKSHARKLSVFIKQLLEDNGLEPSALDAVAVSMGPGSYTGLRIGVSTAKGIAYGSGIPLIGIPTLDALVEGALRTKDVSQHLASNPETLLAPMIDARRMEVYTALYSSSGIRIGEVSARIIDEESYLEELNKGPVLFFGNGSGKCRSKIRHPKAVFVEDIGTSAAHMGKLSEQAWTEGKFEDVAYFEPYYLKNFIATIPRNRILPDTPEET